MKGKSLLSLVFVTLILFGVSMIVPVSAPSTTIGVEPQGVINHSLGAGSWFRVEIWVRNVANLAGVEFKLGYDTTVLTVPAARNITYGGIFGPTYFPLINASYDAQGYCHYSIMEAFGEPAFTGDGKVATINFTVDSQGKSALHLYETKLGDPAAARISHNIIDGLFSNVHMWLHSEGGLINLASPVGTNWRALLPGYGNRYELTKLANDTDSSGTLSICDNINLKNITGGNVVATYGVDEVTVGLNMTWTEGRIDVKSPTTTSVVTAGWTNPTDAYSSNNVYAYTSTASAAQSYGGYGFNIPTGSTITKVKVGYEAYTLGDDGIGITCSWNGGNSWAAESVIRPLPGADPNSVTWIDFTSAITWKPENLTDAKFRTRASYQYAGGKTETRLDWIPVNVTYTALLPMHGVAFEGAISTNRPSSTSAVATGWTNPANAYSSDNSYASTSTASAAQRYGGYGFNIPSGSTIYRVEVGFEAYTAGNDGIGITCSWDGGTSWATEYAVGTLSASDPNLVTWVDFTGATSWTATKLDNTNFRTKVSYTYLAPQSTTYLDWIPVRVAYTNSPSSTPDGTWTNPTNAYSSNNVYANSSTDGAVQQYGTYGFNIPSSATISRVEVGFEAYTAGDENITVTCSWDGGTSWATEYMSTLLTSDPNSVTWVDFTSATSWTAAKLNNTNFRTRVKCVTVGSAAQVYLDWLPVRVTSTNSPSSDSVGVTGWTNPADAYSSNNVYASTSTASAAQQYGGYGLSLPSGAKITKVEVGFEAYNPGNDGIRITCSWDGGTSWATEYTVRPLPTSDQNLVTWVDFTSVTSWTATKLDNTNFRTKASYTYLAPQSTTYLDWIPVRVYYDLLVPDFNWANPVGYQWHETYPTFSNRYNLTSWTDPDSNGLDPGDVIQMQNIATGVVRSCTVTGKSTLIIVTKIAHPVPEFPLGSVLPIALIVAIIYVWWIDKRKRTIKPQ